ncbi:MAG: hypothetical protein H6837_12615 [Planctomycetes bacterium]|nr:hypothetical protein [Planctomycetota bacterium]
MDRTHTISIAVALLVSGSLTPAQSVVATPAGLRLETTEGDDQLAMGWHFGQARTFGSWADSRHQYCDAELATGQPRVLRAFGFRHDYTNFDATTGNGRSWTQVTLSINELDYSAMSATFANNRVAPTAVFGAPVSWPTLSGLPATKPAPFHPALIFPFAVPFLYGGNKAILTDWVFRGGTLASGVWGTQSVWYALDGVTCLDNMSTAADLHPPDNGCNDPAAGSGLGARMESAFLQFSKAHASSPDQVVIPVTSWFTAPGAAVIQGIGLGGSPTGVSIGADCNNLLLDFRSRVFLHPTQASYAPGAPSPTLILRAPRNQVTLGLDVWLQAAWTRTSSNRLALTRAARVRAPAGFGLTDVPPRKRILFVSTSVNSPTGTLTTEIDTAQHPVCFYGL